jgi:DNA-directed RNA polymerase subunit RPC12/RpoP
MIVNEQIVLWKCEHCNGNVKAYVDKSNNLINEFASHALLISQCPYCDYIIVVKAGYEET